MPRLIVRAIVAVAALVVLAIGVACLVYPPEYVRRAIVWGDARADDYLRFPNRRIEPAAGARPIDRAEDARRVQAAWRAAGGGADLDGELAAHGTQAFLVMQGDRIIYERYANGATREGWVTSFSVAKSITSALVGIAIADGAIRSLDDPVTRYLPELAQRDARFSRITLRHLLDMSSGLHYEEIRFLNGDDARVYYEPDARALALGATRIDEEPGKRFHYNNYNPLLVGMVLERATGMSVARFMQARLWQPAGMVGAASWSLDSEKSGFEKMESGINARAEDFARFGRLMLRGGRRDDGTAVVPTAWVNASTSRPTGARPANYYAGTPLAGARLAWYQAFWWGRDRPTGRGDFYASGNLGQFIFISPPDDVVIVRNGWRYGNMDAVGWIRRMRAMAIDLGATRAAARS